MRNWDGLSARQLLRKARPILNVDYGTRFPPEAQPETVSQIFAEFWVALSQTTPFGKPHPVLAAYSGTRFLPDSSTGKRIPL